MSFVILTSKPGQFHTEPVEGLREVESWDYTCAGRRRACFVIAELERAGRVRIVDETPPPAVNYVRTKFLEKFDTLEDARRELESLAASGGKGSSLAKVAA